MFGKIVLNYTGLFEIILLLIIIDYILMFSMYNHCCSCFILETEIFSSWN